MFTLEEQSLMPKTEVAEYQPPAQQQVAQTVGHLPTPPVDTPQTQTITPATQAQPAEIPASTMGEDITWGQGCLSHSVHCLALFAFVESV